jgi:hypothetical protein
MAGVQWVGAVAEIIAGFALGYPAIRLSRQMLLLHQVRRFDDADQPLLEELRDEYVDKFGQLLGSWDPLDHKLLYVGFGAFILSAGLKFGEYFLPTAAC